MDEEEMLARQAAGEMNSETKKENEKCNSLTAL